MNNVQRESAAPLLDIENLRISFPTAQGRTEAVRGVSLRMGRERVAVVGESGSGKSITFRSLLGLLPAAATVSADRMCLEGQDLLSLGARGMRAIRGRRIGMVVQDPKQGLDPLMTIGSQLVEMLRLHRKAPAAGAYSRSMASTYNHTPRPAVVGVRDGKVSVILRRETLDDLLALDAGLD